MLLTDTIAAISSATGPATRMIVRLSGSRAMQITQSLCPASTLNPSHAIAAQLHLPGMQLPIVLYCFANGRSFTGDDLVEFHVPGNPLLCRLLLAECLRLGARTAEPGEFTARAYFSGRIGLTEAEGIAASIASQNEQELRAARQLLAGELARRLRPAMELLAETLALIEAGIDFAGEDISLLPPDALADRLSQIQKMLAQLLAESGKVEQHWQRRRAILVGRPNAGKSTLLNALAKSHRAVVSPQAGTTRDAVSAEVALRRGIIHLVDAAGLDGGEITGDDASADISRQMQATAHQALQTADWVLLIHDLTSKTTPMQLPRPADLIIYTKRDLIEADDPTGLCVSAHTGYHMDQLRDRLDAIAFGTDSAGAVLSLNSRHVQAIEDAQAAVHRAAQSKDAAELMAADLREALDSLGGILGQITPDDVLGRIFSSFCIGK
jgi:tRNA modification GTPase